MQYHQKTPRESFRYRMNFSRTTALEDDPITSTTIQLVSPASGLSVVSTVVEDGTNISALISGGTHETTYLVKFLGNTSGGQILEEDLSLKVFDPLV